jgi:putative molybdopterin biosynthesis protein
VKDGDNYLAFPLFKDTSLITSLSFSDGYIDIPEQLEYLYENSTVTVNIFEENKINKWAIVGSHCVGIDRILARLNLPVRVISIGSLPGIKAIMRKQGDIAGIHLLDEKSGEYNYPYVKDLDNIVLIRGYSRVQGVVTRDKCLTIEDIVNRQILFINRNRGSGTRILLDSKLRELAKKWDISFEEIIRRIDGYNKEVNTHSAVVLSIYHNRADAGIAIQNVAEPYNLKFTPIAVENFDFLVRKSSMKKKEVKKFLEFLRSKEIKEILSDFRIPENIGEIIYEK